MDTFLQSLKTNQIKVFQFHLNSLTYLLYSFQVGDLTFYEEEEEKKKHFICLFYRLLDVALAAWSYFLKNH